MAGQFQTRNVPARTNVNRMPAQMAAQGMTPKEILGIIRRHIFLIVFMTVIGTCIGGGSWFLLYKYAPKYSAQALILVSPSGAEDPDIFTTATPNQNIFFNFRKSKAFSLKQPVHLRTLLRDSDNVQNTSWYKSFGSDEIKRLENLNDNLNASTRKDMNYIFVSMRCGSAIDAALITNEMVTRFLAVENVQAKGDVMAQIKKRNERLVTLQDNLRTAETALEGIREGTKFANLGETNFRSYLDGKLVQVEGSLNTITAEASKMETYANILRKRSEGDFDDLVKTEADNDPTAHSLRLRLISLEMALAEKLTHLGEEHRQLKETRDAIQQTKNEIAKRTTYISNLSRQSKLVQINDELIMVTSERDAFQKQQIEAREEYKTLSVIRTGYIKQVVQRDKIRDDIVSTEDRIRKLKTRHEDPTVNKLQRASSATPPNKMSSPKIKVFVPGGFMLGLMVGIGLAFLIELLNDLVRTPRDIMKHLRTPLLGTICHKSEDTAVRNVELCHVVQQAPYSIMSECYRQLRTNLKLNNTGGSNKSLLITSAAMEDGKTTTAVNLCYTLIADDRSVVLIDTNFQKPSTVDLFPKTGNGELSTDVSDMGLSNYLMGQCDMPDVVRTSGIEGLDIVDSGQMPINTAEMLGSSRMKDIIDDLSKKYDYVIVDGPPLLVSEAKMLVAATDGTIVVFNAMSTRRGTAQRTLRELREINANLVGAVLMGVRSLKGGYFREVYRSYQEYQDIAKSHETVPV
ncbi:MAG: polysaccharide biosynthesis tyrosine autokinase [Planctomycetes bacterium]|nr:polysaccharide biosynthesis tyrosine autokinase [Planctomycetota bacterium]